MRAALIGVGGYGAWHLQEMAKAESMGKLHLVAVADLHDEADPVRVSLQEKNVRWYTDYRRLLAAEKDLDLVVICSPLHWHERMAQAALEETRARILLEKPAFPTIQQLRRMMALDRDRRVRVGFQMIHWPQIIAMKRLLRGQKIERVIVSAGQPRNISYFQRNNWAGRMVDDGEPVFDGVATNAAAHLVHLAFFLADSRPQEFALPVLVQAELYRAHAIESYDFAWLRADTENAAEIQIAVAHSVAEETPFTLRVETSDGHLVLDRESRRISGAGLIETPQSYEYPVNMELYRALLQGDGFDVTPTRLEDTLGYSLLTSGSLISSGGSRVIPQSFVSTDGGFLDVAGLTEYLRAFPERPGPPSLACLPWARRGQPFNPRNLTAVDVATCEERRP